MADEKRTVRTAGVYGDFVLPGLGKDDEGNDTTLVVSPHGVEVTFDQWMAIAEAAEANQVVVRLDEDFPGELYAAAVEKKQAEAPTKEASGSTPETGTQVDGTDTSASGRRSRNGG
jgi:hypothetical protein